MNFQLMSQFSIIFHNKHRGERANSDEYLPL